MKLSEYIDIQVLKDEIEKGNINVAFHPEYPIRIYNYSKQCMYSHEWNDVTMKCRGLVVDNDDNIIALPMEKFFNVEEIEDKNIIPVNLSYDIYEKKDGCLGILFNYDGKWMMCTRGSLVSDQSQHGLKVFNEKYYDKVKDSLDENLTYMFEIIYPEELHIVQYGNTDDIFLIAVCNRETGEDIDIDIFKEMFNVTEHFSDDYDWRTIREKINGDNKEGFVIKFSNGFRMKVKFDYYFKMRVLRDGLTDKKILEHLKRGEEDIMNEMIKTAPEEVQIMYNNTVDDFKKIFDNVLSAAKCELFNCPSYEESPRNAAEYIKGCAYPNVMFCLIKNKDVRFAVWTEVEKLYKNMMFIEKICGQKMNYTDIARKLHLVQDGNTQE